MSPSGPCAVKLAQINLSETSHHWARQEQFQPACSLHQLHMQASNHDFYREREI